MILNTKSAVRPNRWQCHLVEVTHLLNVSYGYTISIWAAGAIAMSHFGPPTLENMFAFVLGAITAYLLLVSITRPGHSQVASERSSAQVVTNEDASVVEAAGAEVASERSSAQVVTNWVPILSAALVSAVCTALPSAIGGYFVASLSATLSYTFVLTVLATARESRM